MTISRQREGTYDQNTFILVGWLPFLHNRIDRTLSVSGTVTFPARLRLLGRRLLAFLLDWLLLLVYLVLLTVATLIVRLTPLASSFNRIFANSMEAEATVFVVLVLPVLLYFALFESSTSQATPGKRWVRLSVVDKHGSRINVALSI